MDTLQKTEYISETAEKWENPAIYILQTSNFNEQDFKVLRYALPPYEIERSMRFRNQRDKDSFIITHGIFRLKLSVFLNEKAQEIRVENGLHGKPYLPDYPDLHFNLSHCRGISLLAFDTKNEIGVDVEEINTGFDWMTIAERFFTEKEIKLIKSEEENGMHNFYRFWTRKEALLKAHGSGINETNLGQEVLGDEVDPVFFLKTLTYLHSYIISTAVSHDSGKVDIYLPGDNCFTFKV